MKKEANINNRYYVVAIIYISIIFCLSSQPESFFLFGNSKTESIMNYLANNPIIWNFAHIPLYSLLGIILYLVIKNNISFQFISSNTSIFIVIFGMTIAVTDEFVQSFSPGRTVSLYDLMLDLTGIIFSICFMKRTSVTNF